MEIWDGYNEDRTFAFIDLIRGQPKPKGIYHAVCEILVRHQDGDFLLMQRDFNKKACPGMWEATAGGSILKGETPLEGAIRELFEETGILSTKLIHLQDSIDQSIQSLYSSYLCTVNCDKSSIKLQESETIAYRWITTIDFKNFMASENCIPQQRDRLKNYIEKL